MCVFLLWQNTSNNYHFKQFFDVQFCGTKYIHTAVHRNIALSGMFLSKLYDTTKANQYLVLSGLV